MAIILVVDDDPTVRLLAGELLRDENHAVIEAGDGVEALQVIGSVPVDLVVLDMLMPNMDGLETIRELRRVRPKVKILAISSGGRMGAADLLRTAMVFGADDILQKPLRLATFAERVESVLRQPASRRSPFQANG